MSLAKLKINIEREVKESLLPNCVAGQYGSVISISITVKPRTRSIFNIDFLLAKET